jgi:transposase InsO family protein
MVSDEPSTTCSSKGSGGRSSTRVYLRDYVDGWQAEKSLGKYFDFYRDERPHQALGYRTPSEVYAEG